MSFSTRTIRSVLDFRGSVSFCLDLGLSSDSFLLSSGST